MKNPLISVVIPAYNSEKTISKCLSSLLNQSYDNYEIIVVDNNSKDSTKDIINHFKSKSKKIKMVFEPFVSRGAARNAGISASKGKIIAMIDSDCIAPKEWIEKITFPIRKHKETVVQGNETDHIKNYWTGMEQEFNNEFLQKNRYGRYIDHLDTKNCAFKKNIFKGIGPFNKHIKNIEDFELKVRINKKGIKVFFLKILAVYSIFTKALA
ncbi:MAG: glycosyltransferase [Candidatus Woesearchaeota archaeon]